MKPKKMLVAVASAAVAAMIVTACGSNAGSGNNTKSSADMNIQVLQLPNQVYDLLVKVGADQGFFKKYGVNVTTAKFPLQLEASQAVKATKSDVLQMTAGSLVAAWQAGVRMKYFCGLQPVIPAEIMAPPGSELPSMADGATYQDVLKALAGKKVAFPTPPGTGFYKLWVAAMKSAGVAEKDVITVNAAATTALVPLLDKGQIDAAYVASTGTQFLKDAGKAKTLMTLADGPPVYKDLYGAAYAAPAADIDARPKAYAAFCSGIKDALAYAQDQANLDAAAATLASLQGLPDNVAELAVKEVFPLFSTDLSDDRIQKMIDTFVSEGVVDPTPVPTAKDIVAKVN
jgi:NitT/TauT family transport system substrate-binding protein